MKHATFLTAGLLGVLGLLVGCGNDRHKTAVVKGNITYKGKAVPNGSVMFVADGAPTATAEIQPDGSYALTTYRPGDGAVLGTHVVVIVAMGNRAGNVLPEDTTPSNPLAPPIVPNQYSSMATSPLRAEVKDQENILNFALEE